MAEIGFTTTRTFNASPEEVFEAWTNPEELARWHGPEGFTNVIYLHDLREGGEYRLTMKSPDGKDHNLRGQFKSIEKPTRLVFTWQWEEGGKNDTLGHETLVTVELKPKGAKTEMTFTHSGFTNEKAKKGHEDGWTSSFKKLEALYN